MGKTLNINNITQKTNAIGSTSENIISLDDYIATSVDINQIQDFMINICITSFENSMYDKDNPVSPYYESEW